MWLVIFWVLGSQCVSCLLFHASTSFLTGVPKFIFGDSSLFSSSSCTSSYTSSLGFVFLLHGFALVMFWLLFGSSLVIFGLPHLEPLARLSLFLSMFGFAIMKIALATGSSLVSGSQFRAYHTIRS